MLHTLWATLKATCTSVLHQGLCALWQWAHLWPPAELGPMQPEVFGPSSCGHRFVGKTMRGHCARGWMFRRRRCCKTQLEPLPPKSGEVRRAARKGRNVSPH